MQKKMQPLLLSMEQSGWVVTSKLIKPNPVKTIAPVATGAAVVLENLLAVEEEEADHVINFLGRRFDIGDFR
jgi:hypothetical protein